MFNLTFSIFYHIIYLIACLPTRVWYFISDFVFLILFYGIKYRKKVAYDNLKRCFPEKEEAELQRILKATFRHLSDVFVEFFREIGISEKELKERMTVMNPEVFRQIEAKGKGVLFLASHYGNFEWMTTRTVTATDMFCYGIYAPLKNRYLETLALKTRKRWGGDLLPARNAIKNSLAKLDERTIIGFVCDQTPSRREVLYFTDFMGQVTAVHDRFAHLALMKGADVYFVKVNKIKRGYYTMELIPLPVRDYLPYSPESACRFTDLYIRLLEDNIRECPEYWLWTHRRWKHNPEEKDILSESLRKKAT
ncbi:MAG: hypothetical protein K1X92_06955 [Bacteroidia bacterium]|nr:hypothetical protein [Bacteroidia bacterium]